MISIELMARVLNVVHRNNCLRDDGQYGLNAYSADGLTDVLLDGNEITGKQHRRPGEPARGTPHPAGQVLGDRGCRVTNNYVHDNRGAGLWADSNNVSFPQGNYLSGHDAEGLMHETSY